MAGIAPLHAPPTARLYIQRNLLSQSKRIEIAMSVAFLFPGQGSQVPGMLHALPDHPSIARTLDEVTEALGENVLALDSPAALRSTVSVQLALLASGVAVARALVAEGGTPEAVGRDVGGSLCRRGGGWRSELCRWSPAAEAAGGEDVGTLPPRVRSRRHCRFEGERERDAGRRSIHGAKPGVRG